MNSREEKKEEILDTILLTFLVDFDGCLEFNEVVDYICSIIEGALGKGLLIIELYNGSFRQSLGNDLYNMFRNGNGSTFARLQKLEEKLRAKYREHIPPENIQFIRISVTDHLLNLATGSTITNALHGGILRKLDDRFEAFPDESFYEQSKEAFALKAYEEKVHCLAEIIRDALIYEKNRSFSTEEIEAWLTQDSQIADALKTIHKDESKTCIFFNTTLAQGHLFQYDNNRQIKKHKEALKERRDNALNHRNLVFINTYHKILIQILHQYYVFLSEIYQYTSNDENDSPSHIDSVPNKINKTLARIMSDFWLFFTTQYYSPSNIQHMTASYHCDLINISIICNKINFNLLTHFITHADPSYILTLNNRPNRYITRLFTTLAQQSTDIKRALAHKITEEYPTLFTFSRLFLQEDTSSEETHRRFEELPDTIKNHISNNLTVEYNSPFICKLSNTRPYETIRTLPLKLQINFFNNLRLSAHSEWLEKLVTSIPNELLDYFYAEHLFYLSCEDAFEFVILNTLDGLAHRMNALLKEEKDQAMYFVNMYLINLILKISDKNNSRLDKFIFLGNHLLKQLPLNQQAFLLTHIYNPSAFKETEPHPLLIQTISTGARDILLAHETLDNYTLIRLLLTIMTTDNYKSDNSIIKQEQSQQHIKEHFYDYMNQINEISQHISAETALLPQEIILTNPTVFTHIFLLLFRSMTAKPYDGTYDFTHYYDCELMEVFDHDQNPLLEEYFNDAPPIGPFIATYAIYICDSSNPMTYDLMKTQLIELTTYLEITLNKLLRFDQNAIQQLFAFPDQRGNRFDSILMKHLHPDSNDRPQKKQLLQLLFVELPFLGSLLYQLNPEASKEAKKQFSIFIPQVDAESTKHITSILC